MKSDLWVQIWRIIWSCSLGFLCYSIYYHILSVLYKKANIHSQQIKISNRWTSFSILYSLKLQLKTAKVLILTIKFFTGQRWISGTWIKSSNWICHLASSVISTTEQTLRSQIPDSPDSPDSGQCCSFDCSCVAWRIAKYETLRRGSIRNAKRPPGSGKRTDAGLVLLPRLSSRYPRFQDDPVPHAGLCRDDAQILPLSVSVSASRRFGYSKPGPRRAPWWTDRPPVITRWLGKGQRANRTPGWPVVGPRETTGPKRAAHAGANASQSLPHPSLPIEERIGWYLCEYLEVRRNALQVHFHPNTPG